MDAIYNDFPLDTTCDEIRLLTIRASFQSDRICCELSNILLEKAKDKYLALSYMWAYKPFSFVPRALAFQNHGDNTIECNATKCEVTPNLYDALVQLRNPDEPTVVWIDQLCINQNPNDQRCEKLHQLNLMGKIYRNAQKTILWLGQEEYYFARKGLDLFRGEKLVAQRSGFMGSILYPIQILFYIAAFRQLLRNPYFSRVWIVQEISLSTNIEVRFGNNRVPFEEFVFAIVVTTSGPLTSIHSQSLRSILAMRCHVLDLKERSGRNAAWVLTKPSQRDMFSIMCLFRASKATNPEDKIFGLIGLCEAIDTGQTFGIKAERESCIRRVYKNTAISILRGQRTLSLFSAIYTDKKMTNEYDLASWVPNWNYAGHLPTPISSPHDAGIIPSSEFDYDTVNDPNSENLILSGNVVDSIGSPEMTCNSAQVWPGMRLCFESIYTSVGSHRMEVFIHWYKKFSPLPEDFNDFINTVTCGASHAYDSETVLDSIAQYQWRSINDIPVYLQRLWILMLFQFVSELFWLPVSTVVFYFVIPQCLASIATPFFFTYFNLLLWPTLAMSGKDKDSFYTDGLVRMEGRAMARTEEKKRLVLVPALALAQDKIILCTGAVCPLLVRPNPDLRTYQVVGECYMHDWQNDYNMKSCETLVIV